MGCCIVGEARYVEAETALSEALKLYRSCVKAQPVLEATAQVLLSQTLAGQVTKTFGICCKLTRRYKESYNCFARCGVRESGSMH